MNKFICLIMFLMAAYPVGSYARDYIKFSELEKMDDAAIQSQIVVDKSPYKKFVKVNGPTIKENRSAEPSVFMRVFLDSDKKEYQIYVQIYYYGDWRFYRSSAYLGGRPAELVPIDSRVVYCGQTLGCSHLESVGVMVDRPTLDKAVNGGLSMALFSKAGIETPIFVPGNYIRAMLSTVDATALPESTSMPQ